MDLEQMLAAQIQKALETAIAAQKPAETVDAKAEVATAIEAFKTELPALVKAAVAAESSREGVGRKGTMQDQAAVTLKDNPVEFLIAKAQAVKSMDDWSVEEKAVIAGLTIQHMLKGMHGADDED